MDKRKKKTTYNQYLIYIQMLEEDAIFRTGILTRDRDLNYLTSKWLELAERLNCCSGGPTLSAEEWKKRLNDWKNSTRAKYRKVVDQPAQQQEQILSPLEQRALLLWGTPSRKANLSIEEEIADQKNYPLKIESVQILNSSSVVRGANLSQDDEGTETEEENEMQPSLTPKIEEVVEEESVPVKRPRLENTEDQCNINYVDEGCSMIATDKLHEVAEQLKRIANIKKEKLKFEIAKFKFRNPGFEYELKTGD